MSLHHIRSRLLHLLLAIPSVVDRVRQSTLQLLRNRLLDPYRHLAVRTSALRMGDVLVGGPCAAGAGVVDLGEWSAQNEAEGWDGVVAF
jgi:hypothetical protein